MGNIERDLGEPRTNYFTEAELNRMPWYGACLKHGRYLWHPHGRRCPVCGRRSAPYVR